MKNKYKFISYDTIDSTNDECKRMALLSDDDQNYVVLAKTQSRGRGAKNNGWESISGNLHMSILMRNTKIDDSKLEKFILETSDCVRKSILALKNLNVSTKAPNDVLIDNKKVAGILVEQVHIKDHSSLIIGIGVNVGRTPHNYQVLATSLKENGIDINPEELAHHLTGEIESIIYQ